MENKKTISYLNGKAWYRALKVVYVLFAIFYCLYAIGVGGVSIFIFMFSPAVFDIEMDVLLRLFLGILAIPVVFAFTWLVLQIPKWIFFYIYLGTITPKE